MRVTPDTCVRGCLCVAHMAHTVDVMLHGTRMAHMPCTSGARGSSREVCFKTQPTLLDPRYHTIPIVQMQQALAEDTELRRLWRCMYVCMYDYIAVSTRTLTPPTTGTD